MIYPKDHLPQLADLWIQFEIDEIHDLSCDQRLLYEYAVGISRGKVDSRYASWKLIL